MQDVYVWSVTFTDDTVMHEDDSEVGRGFAEIGDQPVRFLDIEPDAGKLPAHRVLIPDGATPVFFRRRQIALDGNGAEHGRSTVHCIGWKRGEQGCYVFVFEDGSTLVTDDFQAV